MEVLAIGFLGNLLNYHTLMYSHVRRKFKTKPNTDLTPSLCFTARGGGNYVRQIDNIS